jgi:hypothetical protein
MKRLDEEDDCLLFLAYHVRKSVDPWEENVRKRRPLSFSLTLTDRSYQDQDLSNKCNARGLLILRPKCAENVSGRLPKRSHDDDPTEAIAIQNCLTQVCDCENTEQNGKSYCRREVREVHPQRITCICRNVTIDAGSCVCAEARRAGLDWKIE